MSLGALAFLNPWLLTALAALPVIYWLLRTIPPRPRRVEFPPTRILVGLESPDKQPAKTPWWLTLIRLAAAAFVIGALAEPVLNPERQGGLKGTGPVVIVLDNGWSAAPRWGERVRLLDRLIDEAEASSRPIAILPTANSAKAASVRIEAPADARSTAAALQPQPFAPDRMAAAAALEQALQGKTGLSIVWLDDGIDHDSKAAAFGEKLVALAGDGSLAVVADRPGGEALGASAGSGQGGRLEAHILRAGGPPREGVAHAFSVRGQRLGDAAFKLGAGAVSATAVFDLPLELRNQVTRVEIAGERSAGAVSLLDARAQWQRVGLISGESRELAQPLLAPLYYINKALAPFSEIVTPKDANLAAGIDTVLKQNATVLVLADIGTLSGEVKDTVQKWIENGGVLVRFAGPRLEKGGDDMLPVALRVGGRSLGGALSWSTPQPLAPFDDKSLFAGLPLPQEVTVTRQVLADPARLGDNVAVWARLKDGTPLVTAQRRGQGQIILFHVTANADWSNLPISGLFVEMLRRIAVLGRSGQGTGEATTAASTDGAAQLDANVLPPLQILDGFGILKSPPPTAQPIPAARLASHSSPGLDHPPGYYGTSGAPRALNVIGPKSEITPLPSPPAGAERRSYQTETATPLKPWLLAAALALIFADIVAVLVLQGGLAMAVKRMRPATGAAALLLLALAASLPADAQAQSQSPSRDAARRTAPSAPSGVDAAALKATGKVTLGYVMTGDTGTDEVSRAGLAGLCRVLSLRTAVEPGAPLGIDIERDEIAFFPLIYWPVTADAQTPGAATLAKIDAYMKQGGLIIFDTRDYGQGMPGNSPMQSRGGQALTRIIGRLDVPRLEPVPEAHVLTKAFYLLRSFPGRWDGGQLWVEADSAADSEDTRKARRADGVTSIMITANDFASAWALDDRGRPLYPTVPGGEQQREYAFRAGVNIVMHALTGNYKADQVHVPALLERLGQ